MTSPPGRVSVFKSAAACQGGLEPPPLVFSNASGTAIKTRE